MFNYIMKRQYGKAVPFPNARKVTRNRKELIRYAIRKRVIRIAKRIQASRNRSFSTATRLSGRSRYGRYPGSKRKTYKKFYR